MRYVCSVCGYIYDEAREKQAFSELPDSWRCPVCKAVKTVFVPEKKADEPKKTAAVLVSPVPAAGPVSEEEGMEKLSVGELSALCSNLARAARSSIRTRRLPCSASLQSILLL